MSQRYCGREFTAEDLQRIAELIRQAPGISRAELSRRICQRLGWVKPDGKLKEMSCRVAMLRMQADGLIALPPAHAATFIRRPVPEATVATDPQPPISAPVDRVFPASVRD